VIRVLTLVLSVLLTILVFGMSGQSGTASASLSRAVAEWAATVLGGIFPDRPIDIDLLHLAIRKGAHVAEYLLLGASYAAAARAWKLKPWPVFLLGLAVALLDEGSQAFAEDRGPSLFDALVFDTPGFAAGALILLTLWKKRSPQNNVS
jgi:VanZ family protein